MTFSNNSEDERYFSEGCSDQNDLRFQLGTETSDRMTCIKKELRYLGCPHLQRDPHTTTRGVSGWVITSAGQLTRTSSREGQ